MFTNFINQPRLIDPGKDCDFCLAINEDDDEALSSACSPPKLAVSILR